MIRERYLKGTTFSKVVPLWSIKENVFCGILKAKRGIYIMLLEKITKEF